MNDQEMIAIIRYRLRYRTYWALIAAMFGACLLLLGVTGVVLFFATLTVCALCPDDTIKESKNREGK